MFKMRKGALEDKDNIIQFGDSVFNTDFKTLLPKLYGATANSSLDHYLVEENQEIKAVVGSFPLSLSVDGVVLKAKGIGTVSVHSDARGKGYMQLLMQQAVEDMLKDHIDFSILSGQRQRYEYFGYTPAGYEVSFDVNRSNLKHAHINTLLTVISEDALDSQLLDTLHHMHQTQSVHSPRSKESFLTICNSWKTKFYALSQDDCLVGYVITSDGGHAIHELVLTDYALVGESINTLLSLFEKDSIQVKVPPYHNQLLESLHDLSERYSMSPNVCLNIFNYPKFIQCFLTLKSNTESLVKGRLILGIKNRMTLCIEVGDTISVYETFEAPDLELTHLHAIAFLTSPLARFKTNCFEKDCLIQSWFPLPFAFSSVDNV